MTNKLKALKVPKIMDVEMLCNLCVYFRHFVSLRTNQLGKARSDPRIELEVRA